METPDTSASLEMLLQLVVEYVEPRLVSCNWGPSIALPAGLGESFSKQLVEVFHYAVFGRRTLSEKLASIGAGPATDENIKAFEETDRWKQQCDHRAREWILMHFDTLTTSLATA